MSQVGNMGVQEGEEATWELSGEPSTEFTPKPSESKEPTQESTTSMSGKTHFVSGCPRVIVISLNFVTPVLLPSLHYWGKT